MRVKIVRVNLFLHQIVRWRSADNANIHPPFPDVPLLLSTVTLLPRSPLFINRNAENVRMNSRRYSCDIFPLPKPKIFVL